MRSPQQVAAEVVTQACQAQGYDATAAFEGWLAGHPELMLLDRKPLISSFVLAEILRGQAPTPEVFGKLEAFFHWDDRVEQRRLAQVGLPIESVLAEVEATQLHRVMAQGLARKRPLERRLDAARRAGTGWRAWWLALMPLRRHGVPQLLRNAIQEHGYRAVVKVFGEQVLAFWQRSIEPSPTRMQWIIGLARPLMLGVLVALVGVTMGGVAAVFSVDTGEHAAREAFRLPAVAMGAAGLTISMIGAAFKALQLAMRWLRLGPMQRAWARWSDLGRWLALDRQWYRALPVTVLLLALAWYWPVAFSPLPYVLLVGTLLLLYLRDLASVSGLLFVAVAAFTQCGLHGLSPLLVAPVLPPSLWLGNAAHDALLARRGRHRVPANGSVMMVAGLILAGVILAL